VTAVSHCPGGAWPSYAQGLYVRDNDFYLKWDAISRDRELFTAWIDRHVRGTRDHHAFLASVRRAA
jgi:glutaconate CoA-transferase subunit A